MELLKTDFQIITFDTELSFLRQEWTEKAQELTNETYKLELLAWIELVEKYQPINALRNQLRFSFMIVPELQLWVGETIFARAAATGLKRAAFVVSPDIFTKISIQQTMDEKKEVQTYETRYFDTETAAMQWLRS